MFYLILITLIGINIAPHIFFKHNIWEAQGMWAQLGILICFSWTFIEKQKFEEPKNMSIGLMHFWVGLMTWVWCSYVALKGSAPIHPILGYFNFLCIVMFYRIIVQYLNIRDFMVVYEFLRYSIIATLLVCVLQYFGFSQFFILLHPDYQGGTFINNLVCGFLGNGTHLSGFLAMCLPLFFFKRNREDWLSIILLLLVLGICGQNKGDMPISGVVVAVSVTLYYVFHVKRPLFWIFAGIIGLVGVSSYFLASEGYLETFLRPQGRLVWWMDFILAAQSKFISGIGVGSVLLTGIKTEYPKHLHNEYIQFLVEIGLAGLILMVGVILDFVKTEVHPLGLIYKTIFIGFLVSAVFTYPMHLWLPTMYACFCYAAVMALKEKNKNAFNPQNN